MTQNTSNRMADNTRHLIVFLLSTLILKSIASLGRIGMLFLSGQADSTPSGTIGIIVLATDELINLAWQARFFFLLLFRHDQYSAHWIADASLLTMGVDIPMFNLIASLTLPGFMQQKNYMVFYAFHCALVAFFLPPAHMLAHWVFAGPMFMWVCAHL